MHISLHGVVMILALFLSHLTFSQGGDNEINLLLEEMDNATKNQVSESVYIQTSKDIYEYGEIIWFKSYVLDNQSLHPSLLSKTLYLQVIHEDSHQIVWEEKYEVENGFVDGNIFLRDSVEFGKYLLVAYTPFSFYQDKQEIYAVRQIHIVNDIASYYEDSSNEKEQDKNTVSKEIDFQVFPEGGNLVSDLTTNIAFKAVDSEGEPVEVGGILYEDGKPKIKFETEHFGMGVFELTPDGSKEYYIELDSISGSSQILLPEIRPMGYSLQVVSNQEELLVLKVSKNTNVLRETVFIRVQVRGIIYSVAKADVQDERIIKIPLDEIPQGIGEVTLYDSALKPLAERLVFLNQGRQVQVSCDLEEKGHLKREKLIVRLKSTDKAGRPVRAHLGVSVFDKFYEEKRISSDILSHYHLSSQVKGKIYNPGYYFDESNDDRKKGLNLLLLSQGWRRYIWSKDYLASQELKKKQLLKNEAEGEFIYLKKSKKATSQSMLMVYDPLEEDRKSIVELDSLNNFLLEPSHLKMGRRLFIKHFGGDNEKIRLSVKNPFDIINEHKNEKNFSYAIFENKDPEWESPSQRTGSLKDGIVLEEFLVSAKRKMGKRDRYFERLDSIAKLELTSDYVCEFSDILNCPNHPRSKNSRVPVEGEIYLQLMVWQNDRWVTGVPKNDGDIFKNPPLPPYRYPELTDEYLMKMFNVIQTQGYYGKREFYKPIHDEVFINDPIPDYRNTLFWQADLVTNEQGETQIEFSTSDINSKFKILIEGVTGEGELLRKSLEFNVKKQ